MASDTQNALGVSSRSDVGAACKRRLSLGCANAHSLASDAGHACKQGADVCRIDRGRQLHLSAVRDQKGSTVYCSTCAGGRRWWPSCPSPRAAPPGCRPALGLQCSQHATRQHVREWQEVNTAYTSCAESPTPTISLETQRTPNTDNAGTTANSMKITAETGVLSSMPSKL